MRFHRPALSFIVFVLSLAGLSLVSAGPQEPHKKAILRPAAPNQPQEKAATQILVYRVAAATRQTPSEKRPVMKSLTKSETLALLHRAAPALAVTNVAPYLTQFAPQICSAQGRFTYHNPKQVDCGLAYFYGSSSDSNRIGALEFALQGQTGHQYLALLYVGWPQGPRRFQISPAGGGSNAVFHYSSGGLYGLPVLIQMGNAPSGWYAVKLGPPTTEGYNEGYGGDWFFAGVVVSEIQ